VPGGRNQRVLIVEDNADSARRLITIIHLWGHEARVVYNGAQALDVAKEYRPDVVLLDIGLPGMDGYAVARALRDDPWLKECALLAMTGYDRDEVRLKAKDVGFDRHLLKPLELDALELLLIELAERLS